MNTSGELESGPQNSETSNTASYKILSFLALELPKQYEGMIYSKFLRSLRYGNSYFKLIDQEPYFKCYDAYIKTILTRPAAVVRLAVLSDDEDVVLGWALIEPMKIHYIYVNKDNRRIGIATSLMPKAFDTFTHITNMVLPLWQKKFPEAKFNPFA